MLPTWPLLPRGDKSAASYCHLCYGVTDTLRVEVRCIRGARGGQLVVIKPGVAERVVAEA